MSTRRTRFENAFEQWLEITKTIFIYFCLRRSRNDSIKR